MKKNEKFEILIEDLSKDGSGIGHYGGQTFFVRGGLPGDRLRCAATKLKKSYGFARILEILSPSADRVDPPCKLYPKCGGCQILGLSYEKQLEYKQRMVEESLARIGGFQRELLEEVMEPILGMEHPYHYRNKAQYPVGEGTSGEIQTGFYAVHSHRIIPATMECPCIIGQESDAKILAVIRKWMADEGVRAYDETLGKGEVRHILLRTGVHTGQKLVCLVINSNRLSAEQSLVERLSAVSGVCSISYNINTRRDNVIMGEQTRTIWGSSRMEDRIGTVRFLISPRSFYQVNAVSTEKLYRKALEYAQLTGGENVWDLYCGIGTISLFLASAAKQVYGVEVVPDAVEDARKNAELNRIKNAEFILGKAEEVLPQYYDGDARVIQQNGQGASHPDLVVLDPPRKGCDARLLSVVLQMAPQRIVYVSCDPATLARDLKILAQDGRYALKKACPVDMFGHSMGVETCTLMERVC